MLKVYIPKQNIPEIKYSFLQLTKHLDLPKIAFIPWTKNFTKLENSDNQKLVIFKNYFFSQNYLSKNNLPKHFFYFKPPFNKENLISFYGNPKIELLNNQLIIHPDILATTFFLLTRWEEIVIEKRDKHNRFPDFENFLVKNNLNLVPIVCQYIDWMIKIFKWLNINTKLKQKYTPLLTHDIDLILKFYDLLTFAKVAVNDIIKRKSLKTLLLTLTKYPKVLLKLENDPFDTFDFLMDTAEQHNLKAHFYFIPSKKTDTWAFYDYNHPFVIKTIDKILKRQHIAGIHGSYNGFNKPTQFKEELKRAESAWNTKIYEGRQHFLRFENPTTWQIWNDNNLKFDSTIGFSRTYGFRAGTCYPFNTFNTLTRKQLNLIEIPLIVMEVAITNKYPPEDAFNQFKTIKQIVKKYNGTFTLLWHNNQFDYPNSKEKKEFYKSIVKIIAK